MKFTFAILFTLISFSSFASSLGQDLLHKSCSVTMNKTLTLQKKDLAIEVGGVSLLSMFHSKKLKLSSGKTFPILDVSDGNIAINHGTNLIFLCVNDGDSCLKDLNKVKTSDINQLSDNAISIHCQ